MLATAWHLQVFSHFKMWWLPEFVVKAVANVGDECLVRRMGNAKNVTECRALSKRCSEVLESEYESEWKNVNPAWSQFVRPDIPTGFVVILACFSSV